MSQPTQQIFHPLMERAGSKPLLSVRNIKKTYRMGDIEVMALRGVSLDIYEGEFVAIMGSSGSGKSTFMNTLGCLDQPTSGEYLLDGVSTGHMTKTDLARIRSFKIGFVFQGFNLLSRTSAIENVELPMLYQGVAPKERHDRAMEALKAVGLEKRYDHKPNELSGGQQQRVAIARALAAHPSMILADEPTGNLDSKTSIEIMQIFMRLNDQGITIVLVTHENDIAQYCKRNVVFRDGRIIKDFMVERRLEPEEEMRKVLATSIVDNA
ncbi:MAG TPA: ABC transporter ATP-binding protein [bacterium]|nr:ABC transporter ATP-binding protein [bacterium]HMW36503.1 ABC transporter ATP-binding protein [bacterium]HMY35187.1 ABC transporter ATP-binding protein [bacterium]HMZ03923.1 ABC transporter ATP-binding protein [bacterium]HNB09617.1 ABC transporter ATP-binding protein [bacterium]